MHRWLIGVALYLMAGYLTCMFMYKMGRDTKEEVTGLARASIFAWPAFWVVMIAIYLHDRFRNKWNGSIPLTPSWTEERLSRKRRQALEAADVLKKKG